MPSTVRKINRPKPRWTDRFPALFTGSLILSVGVLLANVGNYLFTVVMARLLNPAMYGDMVTIFAVGAILSVPTAGVVNIISRDVSRLRATDDPGAIQAYRSGARRQLALTGAAVIAVFAAVAPVLSAFLHVSAAALMIYSLVVGCMFLTALNQGTVQGLQRFGLMSSFLAGSVVFKVVLGTGLVLAGFQLLGVVWSVVIAQVLLYVALTAYLYRALGPARAAAPWKLLTRDSQLVIVSMILMYLLINLDLFFAKHFFSPEQAGTYAVLSVLGSVIVFSTASVAAVLLSVVSDRMARGKRYGYLALYGLALVYLPGFAIAAAYVLVPHTIVGLLFPAFPQVAPYLGLYGGLAVILSMLNVLVHYCLAVRDYRFIPILIVSNGVAISLMFIFHQSFFRLIAAAILASVVAVTGLLGLIVVRGKVWRRLRAA